MQLGGRWIASAAPNSKVLHERLQDISATVQVGQNFCLPLIL